DRDRELHRLGRKDVFKVALVGYTNAGKSTLLNALTRSDVLAEDKLFATLDSNVRSLDPNSRPPIVMIDTVGFISQLPHALVASFRSTLRELHEADLLLHVVDASATFAREQMQVTLEVLTELGLEDKPRMVVLNKIDVAEKKSGTRNAARLVAPGATAVSALRSEDVKKLREKIQEHFRGGMEVWEVLIPYAESKMDAELHAHGVVEKAKHHEKGTFYRLRMAESWAKKLRLERFKLGLAAFILASAGVLLPASTFGAPSAPKPKSAYRYDFRLSETALTTTKIRSFEPTLVNPHQARWALEHTVLLAGVETARRGNGKIGVRRVELDAPTRLHLRMPDGPWFVEESRFPCTKEPRRIFATWPGSRLAGEKGAEEWEKILSAGVGRLEARLQKIAEPTTERAKLLAQKEYLDWLDELEKLWNTVRETKLLALEWKSYWEIARKNGLCKDRSENPNLPYWEEVMEPLVEPSPYPGIQRALRPLTRAPTRRWDGAFSARLSIHTLGKKLNGQFLIDPLSEGSVASPSWLSGQGIDPKLLRGKSTSIRRVQMTGMSPGLA
ncbi:MAG: GTPase, partial [Bdellovibrionota bacterium]